MNFRTLRIALSGVAMVLWLAGCGGGSEPPATSGQATVTDAGATINGPDGVVLTVPPGAIGTPTTFRIARDSKGAPQLDGMTLVSPTYAITPHGSTFDIAAALLIPYDAAKIPAGAKAIVLRGEPDGSWHISPLRSDGKGHALVDVGGLSWYSVGYCTPGNAGTFGFGIGDCPANHTLRLEYLDGTNVPIEAPRFGGNPTGWVLPYPLDIDKVTAIPLRVTWDRPAGVNRPDTVSLTVNTTVLSIKAGEFTEVTNFPGPYVRQTTLLVDPTQVPGAGTPNGRVLKATATAEYCWTGFIIGRGPNQTVCWSADTELRFRVRDTSAAPGMPVLEQAPADVDALQGEDAVFGASFRVPPGVSSSFQWQRLQGNNWLAATDPVFTTPATSSAGSIPPNDPTLRSTTLTLKAVNQARDDGARLRLRYCSVTASGKETCALSGEVKLGVLLGARISPNFDLNPASGTITENSTYSVNVRATGRPAPSIRFRVNGVDTPGCAAPGGGATSTSCMFTTPVLSLADSGLQICAVASNDAAHQFDATSPCATVTVVPATTSPVITQGPADQTVTTGGTATFTALVAGPAPLSYQWSFGGAPLTDGPGPSGSSTVAGATSAQLTLSNVQLADAGPYTLTVGNGNPPDATASATLTVNPAPAGCTGGCVQPLGTVSVPNASVSLTGLAVDSQGNAFSLNRNSPAVWKVPLNGAPSVLAGSGSAGGADGQGTSASFVGFFGVAMAIDGSDNLFVTQNENDPTSPPPSCTGSFAVRRITPTGNVSSIRGCQAANAIAVNADASNVYIAAPVSYSNHAPAFNIGRLDKLPGGLSTGWQFPVPAWVTGGGNVQGFQDGPGTTAQFQDIAALGRDPAGSFLVAADRGNCALRKIESLIAPPPITTTLVGLPTDCRSLDGALNAARFAAPTGIAMVSSTYFYVADGPLIRAVDLAAGTVTTIAGLGTNATGPAAGVGFPSGIGGIAWFPGTATASAGLYIASGDKIMVLTP